MGLQHQKPPWQGEVAGEAGALGTGGLLHHLHQHLLARLQQLGNAGSSLAQPQGAQISDVNKAVLFAFADIYKSGVDARQHIFNGA